MILLLATLLISGLAISATKRPITVEILGYAIACGHALTAVALFLFSCAGILPGPGPLLALCVLGGIVCCTRKVQLSIVPPAAQVGRCSRGIATLGILVVLGAAAVLWYTAYVCGIRYWDALAIWCLKANVLAHEPVLTSGYFQDTTLSFSHLDYPLLVPFLLAALANTAGDASAFQFADLYVTQLFGTAAIVYGIVRSRAGIPLGTLAALIVVTLPTAQRWLPALTADSTFSFMLLAAASAFWQWQRSGEKRMLAIAMVCLAGVIFTKNEGMAVLLLLPGGTAVICGLRKQWSRLRPLAIGYGLTLLALTPWFIFRSDLPRTHENYASRISVTNLLDHSDRLPHVLVAFAREAATWTHWGLLPVLALVTLALNARRLRELELWWIPLFVASVLGVYIAVILVTPWELKHLLPNLSDRLLLHVAPLVVLWCGYYCASHPSPPELADESS